MEDKLINFQLLIKFYNGYFFVKPNLEMPDKIIDERNNIHKTKSFIQKYSKFKTKYLMIICVIKIID